MVTTTVKLYTANELSEKALERAYQNWYRKESYNMNCADDDIQETIGWVKMEFGVSFECDCYYRVTKMFRKFGWCDYDSSEVELDGVRAYAYLMNKFYDECLVRPKAYGDFKKTHWSKVNFTEKDGDFYAPIFLDVLREYFRKPNLKLTVEDVLMNCWQEVLNFYQKDKDFHTSKEYFVEYVCLEYEKLFFEDGEEFTQYVELEVV